MATSSSYREGGWGWVIVLVCFMAEFIAFGNLKALGVLITSMKGDFDTELWVVGSIATLHYAVQYLMSGMATSSSYREGGWGWVIVLVCFMAEFIAFGNLKALGVLITSMKGDFDTELWVVGSIATLHYAVQYLMSPLAAALARKFGTRSLILAGGVFYGVGLVVSSFTRSVVILAISLALVSGTGIACILDLIHAEVAFYFHKKYALALFVAITGSPVGVMLYGLITQVLADAYGWRGAMLLLGGVGFHLVVGGMLVRRRTDSYQEVPHHEQVEVQPKKFTVSSLWNSVYSALCLEVFLSAGFIILAAKRMLYSIAMGGAVVYIVPNALALGLTTSQASFLTTAWGTGNLAGMLLSAGTSHFKVLSIQTAEVLAVTLTVLGLLLQPFIALFVLQIVLAVVVGAGMGSAIGGILVMTRCLPFSDDKFVSVLGWQTFLSGVASSIGDTVFGWLSDATGSFHATFFLYGATMATILLCLLVDVIRSMSTAATSKYRGLMVLIPSLFKKNSTESYERMTIQPDINPPQ